MTPERRVHGTVRGRQTWDMDEEELVAAFGLGKVVRPMAVAARGWGDHNTVYRLHTTRGSFAVKAMEREMDELMVERFDIEVAAFNGAIPVPRPVPAGSGGPCAQVGGVQVRCHHWVTGAAKTNEDTAPEECRHMGSIVANLHLLGLPWSPRFDRQVADDSLSWVELAEAGARRRARWALPLTENLVTLEAISASAQQWRDNEAALPRVGSHRDLNAHNVLFGGGDLVLVDWDAAGPIWPPWELACYATLWSARRNGNYDLDAAVAFLAGYRGGGGDISGDEADTLPRLVDNVESWTKKNVRWAVVSPTETQDVNAELLIQGLLSTPGAVVQRQRLLDEAIDQLATSP